MRKKHKSNLKEFRAGKHRLLFLFDLLEHFSFKRYYWWTHRAWNRCKKYFQSSCIENRQRVRVYLCCHVTQCKLNHSLKKQPLLYNSTSAWSCTMFCSHLYHSWCASIINQQLVLHRTEDRENSLTPTMTQFLFCGRIQISQNQGLADEELKELFYHMHKTFSKNFSVFNCLFP